MNTATIAVFSSFPILSTSTLTTVAASSYGVLLQFMEPVLMFIEIVQVIRFILDLGDRLRSKVHECQDEKGESFYKSLILLVSLANIGLSIFLTYHICSQQSYLFAV